jgi:acyl-CoA dehydrogenase
MSPTPDDVQLILEQVRQFVRREVVPAEPEIEERDEIPPHLVARAKAMGLFGFAIPEEYGGLGLSASDEVRLAFELGYTTPALRSRPRSAPGRRSRCWCRTGTAAPE